MSIRAAGPTTAGSCRQCPVSCERVVYPSGCVESGCRHLYAYEQDGRTWFGCVQGIFGVEIDLERFSRLQRTAAGFGALKAVREPLAVCRSEVQRTFEHRADGPCSNPDFLLSGSEPIRRVVVRRPEPSS